MVEKQGKGDKIEKKTKHTQIISKTVGEEYKDDADSVHDCRNYGSEVFAFSHRIGAPEVEQDSLVRALTNESFFNRPDVEAGASGAAPSRDQSEQSDKASNKQLVEKGVTILSRLCKSYLRYHLPEAPEELVEIVTKQLLDDELLSEVAKHVGVDVLVRTCEHPPSAASIADAFRSLIATVDEHRARALVIDMLMPQLIDIDFADIFPLNSPLAVLTDLLGAKKGEVEPRLLRSMGEMSAQPLYVVGLYKDHTLVGQSAGESLTIATDMAAREALLRLWGITSDRVFFFGDKAAQAPLDEFEQENYRLKDKCDEKTDLSLQTVLEHEPLNIVEVALRYKNEVDAKVGKSYTKRLRHKFSRGSLAKRSFRYLVKPKVYTVS